MEAAQIDRSGRENRRLPPRRQAGGDDGLPAGDRARRGCVRAYPRPAKRLNSGYREAVKKLRLALPAAVAAALVATSAAAAFTPTNTYYPKQWYLAQDQAFDAWPTMPALQPVKVALIDSGVECALPDFASQIAASKSFVGGSACIDNEGHGTIVAGEIAGALNAAGVVGLAYSSQLVVAKVVASDGTIPLKAEADAIRWAVQQGARVINMSFGAVRDPLNPALDTYSKVEAQAVAYAVKHGAIVVAAVGNSDEAYATPWPYASWPAALPHVIGVGALSRSGDVPDFSDHDPIFVDLAAPGMGIFSTFPKAPDRCAAKGCVPQGYTDCATGDYHQPEGTSFAAPQVSAAAAVLLGLNPALTPSQVDDDPRAEDRRRRRRKRLRRLSDGPRQVQRLGAPRRREGGGRGQPGAASARRPLRAQRQPLAGAQAEGESAGRRRDPRLLGRSKDVYRVKLARGQRLLVRERGRSRPGLILRGSTRLLAQTAEPGKTQRVSYRVRRTGWYYVEMRVASPGAGRYSLRLTESS